MKSILLSLLVVLIAIEYFMVGNWVCDPKYWKLLIIVVLGSLGCIIIAFDTVGGKDEKRNNNHKA